MRDKRALQNSFADGIAQTPKRHLLFLSWGLIAGVTILANCQKPAGEPVALLPEDMCAYCRMAISEKVFAAELIDNEGQAFKFDDIGCMLNFIKSRKSATTTTGYFVMDFNERKWIKAGNASYVRSAELKTPMNGGIIAFPDQSKAEEALGKYPGKILSFQELLNP